MNSEVEREQLEVDALLVGAGPASLSAAFHLSRLVVQHNQEVEEGTKTGTRLEPTILVIEKGKEIGSHGLSGAVIDPRGFEELLQGSPEVRPPYESPVKRDSVYYLTETKAFRLPITPPPLRNHGAFVASLGQVVRWLGDLCEANGVEVYAGFPAAELLFDGDTVIGARIADVGRGRDGNPKVNFEPGMDVLAKVTLLGEGPCGTLAGQAARHLDLCRHSQPQLYALGVKEIWKAAGEVEPGSVYHTMGFPLGSDELGGGFVYTMNDNLISLGFVAGIDSRNPKADCHLLLQKFKTNPLVKSMLEGGKLVSYGAKTIPEGGFYAMPRPYADGLLIAGDSAGFLNSQRLKGIHLAVKSGMLAAETIFEALLKDNASSSVLQSYQQRIEKSWAHEELRRVRNFRQSFQGGLVRGFAHSAVQFVTGGRGIRDPFPIEPGHSRMQKLGEASHDGGTLAFDGKLTFDKLSSVYYSDTGHEEDQPVHLKVLEPSLCDTRCTEEFGNPCQHFCPANVYEILSDAVENRLRINFSNCVHCKTCEIADPYQIIRWTPPEGGGGPDWKKM